MPPVGQHGDSPRARGQAVRARTPRTASWESRCPASCIAAAISRKGAPAARLSRTARGEPAHRLRRLRIVQNDPFLASQDLRLDGGPLGGRVQVLSTVPVQLALGKGGVVPRERRQHLFRIARGFGIRKTDFLALLPERVLARPSVLQEYDPWED